MRFWSYLLALMATVSPAAPQTQYTSTSTEDIARDRAAALTLSPTSNILGKTFDCFVTIWLENTNYADAAADKSFQWIASQGITLTNYWALAHPSQPNYVAAVGGDRHGIWTDGFWRLGEDVKTIVDLLEANEVSWSEYMEDSPYSGFEGDYQNQITGAKDYVRKHNPLMSYDSVTSEPSRLAKIKNFTVFYEDLENETLPQWMFITPNMTNDGHDTDVKTSGEWSRSFLSPLLNDPKFLKRTLILLTFDESESYFVENRVFSVLLGDAVPAESRGTSDPSYYTHYSQMATVERNWDLGDLGLEDRGAVPFF